MTQVYLVSFTIALLVAFILTPYIKKLAVCTGVLDAPDERKVHTCPIPRMGGLAIYAGFVLAIVSSLYVTREIFGLILGATVILVVGIIDDIYQLPAKYKLFGQILAALVLVVFDIRIEWISNPFGEMIYVNYFSIPLTIFWVVGLTNTLNLIDGLDGLAAGVSVIASITICLVAIQQSFPLVAIMTAALAGGALGFMRYNFNPATIFMGDTGSMFLGYTLAAISIFGTVKSAATIALFVPIVALGLPIMDTAFAIIRRFTNGRPIFKPDKGHLHHRLLAMGLTQKQAVLLMYVISACLGLSAFALTEVNSVSALIIIVAIISAVVIGAKKIGVLKDVAQVKSH